MEKRSKDSAGARWMRASVDCTSKRALPSSYVSQAAMLTALTGRRPLRVGVVTSRGLFSTLHEEIRRGDMCSNYIQSVCTRLLPPNFNVDRSRSGEGDRN